MDIQDGEKRFAGTDLRIGDRISDLGAHAWVIPGPMAGCGFGVGS